MSDLLKKYEDVINELFYCNKSLAYITQKHNMNMVTLRDLVAKSEIEWDHDAGAWKNNKTGRLSPGTPRHGMFSGTAPSSGYSIGGGSRWSKQGLDEMCCQVISKESTVADITTNNDIHESTVKRALYTRGYKFISKRVGWARPEDQR